MSRVNKINNTHNYTWLLFLGFPFLLLIRENYSFFWGPEHTRFLTMSYAFGISLVFAVRTNSNSRIIAYPTLAALSLFVLGSAVSTYLSPYGIQKWLRWAEITSYIMFVLCTYRYFYHNPPLLKVSLLMLSLTLWLILASLALMWHLLEIPQNYNWTSRSPFVVNVRHLSTLVCLLLPIGFYWLSAQKQIQRVGGIVHLTLSWALLIWLGGRGGALSALFVSLLAFFCLPKLRVWVSVTPFLGWLISQPFNVNDPALNLFRFSFDAHNLLQNLSLNSSGRIDIYRHTLMLWWQQSPLLGLGADAYHYNQANIVAHIEHPHNLVMQMLLAFGLLGTFSLGFLAYKYIRYLYRANTVSKLVG